MAPFQPTRNIFNYFIINIIYTGIWLSTAADATATVWWTEGAYKVMEDCLFRDGRDFAKDPMALLEHRRRVGETLRALPARREKP